MIQAVIVRVVTLLVLEVNNDRRNMLCPPLNLKLTINM
jgi:hypothetical protein